MTQLHCFRRTLGVVTVLAVTGTPALATAATSVRPAAAHLLVTSREISDPAARILTNSHGRVLYLYTRDTANHSRCTGSCRQHWPAAASGAAPRAGSGVDAGELGRSRSGQVTYYGHPLYYASADTRPGRHSGEGAHVAGGRFFLVTTTGKALKPVDCSAPGALCGTASS